MYLLRSKSSQKLKGIPIHAKLQLEDCKTSVQKVKTETSVGKRAAYQGTAQPKKRQRTRKSDGTIKNRTPIQNSGKLENVS